MTFRNFAIVTALTSATALAAQAADTDTTNIYDDDGDRQATQETSSETMGDATVDAEGNVTAPFAGDASKPNLTQADPTSGFGAANLIQPDPWHGLVWSGLWPRLAMPPPPFLPLPGHRFSPI